MTLGNYDTTSMLYKDEEAYYEIWKDSKCVE